MVRDFIASFMGLRTKKGSTPVISDIPEHKFNGRSAALPREMEAFAVLDQVSQFGFQPVHHNGANYLYDPLSQRIVVGVRGNTIYTELSTRELSALTIAFPESLENISSEWHLSKQEFQKTFKVGEPSAQETDKLQAATEQRKAAEEKKKRQFEARFEMGLRTMHALAPADSDIDVKNSEAISVRQHAFDVSDRRPLGTDFLMQCHALVIYNPRTKAAAFAHIDGGTDSKSIHSMWECVSDGKPLTAHLLTSPSLDKIKAGESLVVLDQISERTGLKINYGSISQDSFSYVFYPDTGTITRETVTGPSLSDPNNRDKRFQSPLIPQGKLPPQAISNALK